MARRKLNLADQLKGVKAALRSRRTPPQLRQGLKKRAEELQHRIREGRPNRVKKMDEGGSALELLGL